MQPVPPLSSSVANLPLGRAIMRALEKDPERRFSSADEFAAALDGAAATAQPPIATRTSMGTDPTPALPTDKSGSAATTTNRKDNKLRHSGGLRELLRRYWIALVVVALLAILAATQLL
jgi:hypothetical protein